MKLYLILTSIVCLILLLFPLGCVTIKNQYTDNTKPTETTVYQSSKNKDESVSVFVVSADKTVDLKVYDYLVGAVAAEMPASFQSEALKAQAVACYSYMMWLKNNSDNAEYDITSDPSVHQGYLTKDEMKEKWGDKYEFYHQKISDAVSAVQGQYLTYEGEAVLALFHAISPGTTQESSDVWESPLPYIKSKPAPGDSLSPDFDCVVTVPCRKIREIFEISDNIKDSELVDIFSLSDSSFIKEITLGNKSVSAGDIASELGLNSPYFTAEYKEGNYIFKVKGKGHGLGMSQYSADYMARQGSTYEEILTHFYSGVKLRHI
jgi:stage II sporulation protein D